MKVDFGARTDLEAEIDDALGFTPDEAIDELDATLIPEGWKRCQKVWKDGRAPCEALFEPINSSQKYCREHQVNAGARREHRADPKQPRPTSVTNNIKVTLPTGAKKTDDIAKSVEAGAAAMLGMLPVVFAAIGDQPCADIFTRQVPAIAHQLGELARYHKGLEKFFAGAEGTGELFAWVGLIAVTLPALIAVMLHHNLVKGILAERLQTISDSLEAAGGQ